MTHVDHPQNSDQTPDQTFSLNVRRNAALFWSRRGADDFIPGINFSGNDVSANYPQFIISPSNEVLINYTSGVGGDVRRSLKIVKVTPLPADDTAYVHPRSVNTYNTSVATDPTLVAGSPPYYDFNGLNKALSTTTLTASTGVTYTAWLKWSNDGQVVMDSRAGTSTTFGQVFFLTGLAVRSLNFFHGFTLNPDTATFVAAVIDNTAQTVTLYAATGSGFQTKTGYYKSILFAGQPANNDTLTANSVTYTFKTSASLTNDVAIGVDVDTTIANLATKLQANSMATYAPGSNRLLMSRSNIATFSVTSGSSQISVESGIPLNGGVVAFGKTVGASSLTAYAGRMYEARVYASATQPGEPDHPAQRESLPASATPTSPAPAPPPEPRCCCSIRTART
jgi:hypothetical protein